MRRILTVTLLSLLCFSLQAQLLTFKALKDGVIDDAEIKKELILNGFTKVSKSSDSSGDTYAFGYDEDKEAATIWVAVSTLIEFNSGALYMITVETFGHFVHKQLTEEIVENCTFDGIGTDDELMYTYEYSEFSIASEDGSNMITVFPIVLQLPFEAPVMEEVLEALMEVEVGELIKEMEEIEEE